jgi:hypothetical protein
MFITFTMEVVMRFALMILGFLWWWPLGLAMLAFLFMRRRRWRQIGVGEEAMFDGSFGMQRWERKMARAQEKVERVRERMERYAPAGGWFAPSTSGNAAFDEYRAETLKRLEDEQREFKDFLERLRVAKDRAEFDNFMANRRRSAEPEAPPAPPAPQG